MTTIKECPICSSTKLTPYLQCTDYTVSRETFHLQQCESCSFVLTNPRPDLTVLGKYYQSEDYISHTNQAASLIDRIYLHARKFTLNWKLSLINDSSPTHKRLLDYGCGTGAFLKHCIQNGWAGTGIEPSHQAREIASKEIHPIVSSIEQISGNNFDVITLWHVLEHVPNLNETIQRLSEHLSETGTMFIAVPNYNSWDGKHYKNVWAGYDVPRHLWHFSQTTMNLLMKKNGLQISRIVPMKLDSFYVSMLSEKYLREKSTIIGAAYAFFKGLLSNFKAAKHNEYSSLIYVVKK